METITVSLRGAFKNYEKDVITREAAEEIINDFAAGDIIQKGIDAHVDNHGNTTVYLDLSDGELEAVCFSTSSGYIEGSHHVDLYTIQQNTMSMSECDTLKWYLEDDKLEEYQRIEVQEPDLCGDEILERIGADEDALFWEWFFDCAVEGFELNDNIEEQLDEIYECVVVEEEEE